MVCFRPILTPATRMVRAWMMLLVLLLSCCLVAITPAAAAEHTLHEAMNARDLHRYFSGEHGPEYDLMTPTSRDADGEYLSHQLETNQEVMSLRRQRRHADNHDEEKTFLHLEAFGEDHHMELTRNRRMLHEDFTINIHDHDDSMRTEAYTADCYHHGNLKNHGDSEIAMSNCDGELMGTIRRKREIYHVHPLAESLRESKEHNPNGHTHLVHRVREKKASEAGHAQNDEQLRSRSKRQTLRDIPPVSARNHTCHEEQPLHSEKKLQELMLVDMPDTVVLDEFQSQGSSSRDFGNNYVHAAIFLDQTVYEKYDGDEDFLIRYHLTQFNMVSLIYQPGKTQYAVYIVLINLRIFTVPQNGLYITQDSRRLLNTFCAWQQTLNPPIGRRTRWNHAFLVTGYGMCFGQNADCGELGRAPIEGVCIPDRECSVNRDGGLNGAFVLAHELGHNLGMFHDGHPTEAPNCPSREGYLMAPSTGDAQRLWEFSSCSKAHLRRYLRSQYTSCMDKSDLGGPSFNSDLSSRLRTQCRVPPGQLFNRDEQCRTSWRHQKGRYYTGHSFKFCSRTSYGRRDICKHLYCDNGRTTQGCYSTFTPALDGTVCGNNMVCWRYQCVPAQRMYTEGNYCAPPVPSINDVSGILESVGGPATTAAPTTQPPTMAPIPLDGGWSFFSAFSRCTATCGGGIRYRQRICNNPTPRNGGRACVGEERMYEVCSTQRCADGSGYREAQCSRLSGTPWMVSEIRRGEDPCANYCEQRTPDGRVRRFRVSREVLQGTECTTSQGVTGRCIQKKCVAVGCDNIIGSTAKVDECGKCKGTGDTCVVYSGMMQNSHTSKGDHIIRLRPTGASIPRGSWDISLRFIRADTASLMVLRDNVRPNYRYYLHGPGTSTRTGNFAFAVAGAFGRFSNRPGGVQRLTIARAINTPLVLMVRYDPQQGQPNGVVFHFKMPRLPPGKKFFWKTVKDYGECSVTCGRGVQTKEVQCRNNQTGGSANPAACMRAGKPKPMTQVVCTRAPCQTCPVLKADPPKSCTECRGNLKNMGCMAQDSRGNFQTIAPRMCPRMERMTAVEQCDGVVMMPAATDCAPVVCPAMCNKVIKAGCPACDCGSLNMMNVYPSTCPQLSFPNECIGRRIVDAAGCPTCSCAQESETQLCPLTEHLCNPEEDAGMRGLCEFFRNKVCPTDIMGICRSACGSCESMLTKTPEPTCQG